MSAVLVVGTTQIPYDVRESLRAKRKRIEVTPAGVAVVVPEGTAPAEVIDFVREKRRWVFDRVTDMAARTVKLPSPSPSPSPSPWANGCKVLWRGRRLTVHVALSAVDVPVVVYRSRFDVRLPLATPPAQHAPLIQQAIEGWMQQRALSEARALVARYAVQAGVVVRRVEVRPMLRLWGSCGRDGVIRLDSGFMKLPAHLGAYLAAHEVVHLLHRDHSAAFWRVLRTLVPDARRRHDELMESAD